MIKCTVMDLVRSRQFVPALSQLRIGRVVGEEQKGKLEGKTVDEVLALLQMDSPEQMRLDAIELGQIQSRQEKPDAGLLRSSE